MKGYAKVSSSLSSMDKQIIGFSRGLFFVCSVFAQQSCHNGIGKPFISFVCQNDDFGPNTFSKGDID